MFRSLNVSDENSMNYLSRIFFTSRMPFLLHINSIYAPHNTCSLSVVIIMQQSPITIFFFKNY